MNLLARLPSRTTVRMPRVWRLWACAMALGLLAGVAGFPGIEGGVRYLKSRLHQHPASGRVAVVEIDDHSLAVLGRWPIPRSVYATLTDTLFAQGARSVTFDFDLSSASNPVDDARFAAAIARHPGGVVLANRFLVDPRTGRSSLLQPLPAFARVAKLANLSMPFDSAGKVGELPYAVGADDGVAPGIAAAIAERQGTTFAPTLGDTIGALVRPDPALFQLDGSIRLESIPRVPMSSVLRDSPRDGRFAGRDVLVGPTTDQVGDMYVVSPYGRIGGVLVQAIGAETLFAGMPRDLGGVPALLLAGLIAFYILPLTQRRHAIATLGAAALALPLGAAALPVSVSVSVVPAIAVLLAAACFQLAALIKDMLRSRAMVNQISGLLNLTALRQLPSRRASRLVVAHIHNFAEATATLPSEGEAILIAQIASRLRLGMTEAELYHGDNGVFAWFSTDDVAVVGERLDALHALFRSAVTVAGQTLDLVVTFGVDDDESRSIANRLGSALVAAAEALAEGGRWREFDKAKLADTAWKLSMLSELDAAIDDGHLWVAYQPKLDLRNRRIVGAEALVRWTHPEKGAISPIEFVAAAEQHNRIEKLTAHVLERAVLAAATINTHDIRFGIAVNLSARLLDEPGLVEQVAAVLAKHGLDPTLLTLEVTETASLATDRSLDTLHALRALGVHISIDDYGTGLSTLEYLRKIPAGEIKIDRSFVQSVLSSSSDLLMVNSTIQLAHSLGHTVVAEGVESADILLRLAELGCDIAQGYHIGRPMTFQDLARRLLAERRQAA